MGISWAVMRYGCTSVLMECAVPAPSLPACLVERVDDDKLWLSSIPFVSHGQPANARPGSCWWLPAWLLALTLALGHALNLHLSLANTPREALWVSQALTSHLHQAAIRLHRIPQVAQAAPVTGPLSQAGLLIFL